MRAVFLAVLLVPAAVHAVTLPNVRTLPDFTVVASRWPPYTLATNCSPGETAVVFYLTVHNIGSAASAAVNDYHAVWVQDNANPSWAGGATLPAIPSWGTATVTVGLVGLKSQDAMAGHHQFTATVNGAHSVAELAYNNNTLLIDVDVPAGFCGPVIPVAKGSSTTVPPRNTTPMPGSQEPPQRLGVGLPAPTNLTNTITQGVCAKYGGPAAAFACSVALPAGKLVLVWDYPFSNPVDGYHVYAGKPGGTPATTQTAPGVRLAILDPPPVGTCYVVTAFHGTTESLQSATSFCVTQGNLAKTVTFTSDQAMSMIKDVYINPDQPGGVNPNQTGTLRSAIDGASVGTKHSPRDENTVLRAYLHFNTSSLSGHPIAKAVLQLRGGVTEGGPGLCFSQYGAATNWAPGQVLDISGPRLTAIIAVQGADVDLDVTPVVQSWANAPGSTTAFTLRDGTDVSSAALIQVTKTCINSYKGATLKVVYY